MTGGSGAMGVSPLASDAGAAAVLAGLRVAGVVAVLPLGVGGALGVRLKAAVAGVLGAGLAAAAPLAAGGPPAGLAARLIGPAGPWIAAGELLLGALLGGFVLLALATARGAARLVSEQIGLSGAAVVDPVSGADAGGLARLHAALAALVFFAAGLHRSAVSAVAGSFARIGPGDLDAGALPAVLGNVARTAGADLLVAAASLVLPVVAAMLVVSLVEGMLGRVLPEAELLVFGQPLRIGLGLAVLAATLPRTAEAVRRWLEGALHDGARLVDALGGG